MHKILVVCAAKADLSIIKNTLSEYSVSAASDIHEAMEELDRRGDIDLVILDLELSGPDGSRFLEAARANSRNTEPRVIILTGHKESENETKGLPPGASDFLRKPISAGSLKTRIMINTELLELQKDKQKLLDRDKVYDTIFQQVPIGIAISSNNEPFSSGDNMLVSANRMFEHITGRSAEELKKLNWTHFTHPDDLQADVDNYMKLLSGEINGYSMEKRYIKPDGSIVWVHMVVAPITLAGNDDSYHIVLIQDITNRKETECALTESERSKSVLLSHLPGLAYRCKYERDWTMQYVSYGCYELTGYLPESLLYNRDISFNGIIAPEYREALWNEWERILSNKLPFKYEYEIITARGERKWVLEMGEGVYNAQGEVEALEGIILDISDRKKMENNLRYNSEHDIWTGLLNRRHLENLLLKDAVIPMTEKRAVIAINLNAVHLLSMSYGFHYSQELIKRVADALKSYCSDKCLLYNTYENRFVFYLKGYKSKAELTDFCRDVENTLECILAIERISGSIGVIEIAEHNKHDVEQLLKKLLIVSEKAANNYENDFGLCFFDDALEARIAREEEINHELSQIASGTDNILFLQYQPILDLKTGQICGFEALARINSRKLGLIPPMDFIPIAEKTKLIVPVGDSIIHQALSFLKTLMDSGYDSITVSINISAIQLLRHDFIKNLLEKINDMQVNPEYICLEITESIFASNFQEINRILGQLKELKIKIAIDDFGTGYSSLARERELNINCLKIDKFFIDKLLMLKSSEAITGDIISMAHKLGHCVIAEGIEHEKQRQYLKDHGCDMIQGYLVSRPMNETDAIRLLEQTNESTFVCENCNSENYT